MKHLSLKRLRGGSLGWRFFTGDPGMYVKKVSGYGYLSPLRPLSILGEPGMLGRGGSYTGDFDRKMKEGSSGGAFLCLGFHQGDLEGELLCWEPER